MPESNILSSIEQICHEKKLSKEQVLEAIEQALAAAYRKDFGHKLQNISVKFDPETGQMEAFDEKTVVDNLPEEDEIKDKEEKQTDEEKKRFNPKTEIQISEAKKIKKKIKINDVLKQKLEIPSDFGRIAAQTAKQVIIQRLREAERQTIFEKYETQVGTVIDGVVQRRERQIVFIDLLDATAVMPYNGQVSEERYWPDQKLRVYVVSVNKTSKGPEIIVSRRHPNILKELFKLEIPEINNNTVEIKIIAREPGSRSKVAVWTKEESIDPIGSCIGQRGIRIQTIINEIGGEKIDIIEYSDDPEKFIANALAPAKISSLKINEKENSVKVRVNKNQLSLAIGKGGQNVRLAAKLTGWRIEVEEEKKKTSDEQGKEKVEKEKKTVKKKSDKETKKKEKKKNKK